MNDFNFNLFLILLFNNIVIFCKYLIIKYITVILFAEVNKFLSADQSELTFVLSLLPHFASSWVRSLLYYVPRALLFFLSLSLFRPRRARKLLVSSYIQFQLHVPRGTDALDAGLSFSLSPPLPRRMQHPRTSEYVQLSLFLSRSLRRFAILSHRKKNRLSYCFNGSCVCKLCAP